MYGTPSTMAAEQEWRAVLDSLPGLSVAEKGRARLILSERPPEKAWLLVSGSPDVAAETVKALLGQHGQKGVPLALGAFYCPRLAREV